MISRTAGILPALVSFVGGDAGGTPAVPVTTLILPPSLREILAAEAARADPRECCGLIEGVARGDRIEALALHPARNLAGEPDRFAIDPADQFRLLRALRGSTRAIIGCYHSHPNGAPAPSVHDREGAGEDDFVWLIAGVRPGAAVDLAAFLFAGGAFRPLRLAPSLDRQARRPV